MSNSRNELQQRLYDLAKTQVQALRPFAMKKPEEFYEAVDTFIAEGCGGLMGKMKKKLKKEKPDSKMEESAKHPGFKAVAAKIARKQGVSKGSAAAILANSSRHASAKAKKANPRLKKV